MTSLPHLPALRLGRAYESLDKVEVRDLRSNQSLLTVSQVNAGILRRDLTKVGAARGALQNFSCSQLLDITKKAGDLFLEGTLPLGDRGHTQSPQQFIETLSSTSGLTHGMVRRNMSRIQAMLAQMPTVLRGLTRGLDLSVIDSGVGEQAGCAVSFFAATESLGLVMPSNSPAVNSLWLPAIALKIPVLLKPGREEPLTPYRLIQAFLAAGCPAEAFGFYPTDHEGAAVLLNTCGRALIFGDKTTTAQYAHNPHIEIHGPGYSKIIIGADAIECWPDYLDVLISSIAENGGRSCLNASTLMVPSHAAEIAEALAQKLGPLAPLPATDENARLSAFANPKMADSIQNTIEEGLRVPGATDLTAKYRNGPRLATLDGGVYLRPSIILCDSLTHPLALREFLFPYTCVVKVPQEKMLEQIGPSLVVTAITRDPKFRAQLMASPHIDRLNLGPISTMQIAWDQPHEGNLFEFLYQRRALQRV